MTSRVKWFNNKKGYGFLEQIHGEDIFVHYSDIIDKGYRSLEEGQIVYFDLVESSKGLQAKNVIFSEEEVNI